MIFGHALPFTSDSFFIYMLICIGFVVLSKVIFKKIIGYKFLITTTSLAYIFCLFPKPFHLIGLIIFLYVIILLLRKYYKHDNILFPMLLLALPIFVMKTTDVIPINPNSDVLKIIRIAGLSYMVFKAMSLYIDMRRSTIKIAFIDVFNFLSFVPTLLIGPLDRFERFNNDVRNGYENVNSTMYTNAWYNLLLGLLYKFIIAEAIRRLILAHLIDDNSFFYHLSYMYTYLMELFFDFAGYSLLAISFGGFLGIHVPINFDEPFLALNPKEFWKKWHKSLGDWLNDYFFKPLFKYFTSSGIWNSIQRQNVALMLTFTLMGFWNGFELHYIVSGMLFGIYAVIHNYYVYKCKKNKKDVFFGKLSPFAVKWLSIFIMFNSVAFAIYVFSGKLF